MYQNRPVVFLFLFLIPFFSCKEKTASGSGTAQKTVSAEAPKKKTILIFGNSLTAGYGLESPATEAFPAKIQARIDSLNLPYTVINGGNSGETTAGGLGRIEWALRNPVDIFILELGANDGLRGIPVAESRKNLQSIIDQVKAKYPDCKIILAGMQVPPNMGQTYSADFRNMFPDLAVQNKIALIPFLLEGVGGEARLNLQDGIHPTEEGHRILADHVWKVLQPML